MRSLPAILAIILLGLSACSRNDADREKNNFTHVKDDDAEMNEAIANAKSTIGSFVEAFHAAKPETDDFSVKKPYRTPTGGQEHMWIAVTDEKDGVITGVVANDAEETKEVKDGQIVSLKTSEISDWKYQDGKKLIGGFTIRYFVNKMPPKEREAFLKEQGFEL